MAALHNLAIDTVRLTGNPDTTEATGWAARRPVGMDDRRTAPGGTGELRWSAQQTFPQHEDPSQRRISVFN